MRPADDSCAFARPVNALPRGNPFLSCGCGDCATGLICSTDAARAGAMVRPYFSYLLHATSRFWPFRPAVRPCRFQAAGAPRTGLPPKPGLSRESQRVRSRVHKTFRLTDWETDDAKGHRQMVQSD